MATVEECTYPDLFSRVTMKCDRFEQVDCDHRPEPQAPCEYVNRRKLNAPFRKISNFAQSGRFALIL